jgi:7-cyano-7-deazaguanine synthase in queuosine biosynthesis
MEKTNKKILVSFSGGLDSTYLVYDNLRKGNTVTGLYTTIKNNINKIRVETHQTKKLGKLFKEDFPGQFTLDMGIGFDIPSSNDLIFKQTLIWLVSLLYHHSSSYDEVQIGAVMNDDMISFIDDIKNIWESFSFLNPKHPILTFPLMKNGKAQLSDSLPKKYKDLVVFCENPTIIKDYGLPEEDNFEFTNCGECHSCKRYEFDKDIWNIEYGQIKNSNDPPSDDTPASNGILIGKPI